MKYLSHLLILSSFSALGGSVVVTVNKTIVKCYEDPVDTATLPTQTYTLPTTSYTPYTSSTLLPTTTTPSPYSSLPSYTTTTTTTTSTSYTPSPGMSDLGPFVVESCSQNVKVANSELQISLTPDCGPTLNFPTRLSRGRFDIVMRAGGGSGVVTAIVLYGPNNDEVDIELVGKTPTNFQSMYFPRGQRNGQYELYHESSPVSDLTATYHKYSIERTDSAINWYIDDNLARSLPSTDPNFPGEVNFLKFGIWDGSNTSGWAGTVDYSSGPKSMAIKSITYAPSC
ncbi:hypothetical protein BB560_006522 [Smittium megazygosporum]|uniref:GH16 domain-containing protein n=1 Tax=Smittium megazygosporum TaxID=133381 RepID=A0A2T9Y4I4_9FUNG|nr:hypothetical protein BB560_006522 [Smittium megazygosporum]